MMINFIIVSKNETQSRINPLIWLDVLILITGTYYTVDAMKIRLDSLKNFNEKINK